MIRTFWRCKKLDDPGTFEEKFKHTNDRKQVSERKANLVGSWTGEGDWHLPVLDLDLDARLVPSSTGGHYHLYIDTPCHWHEYEALLVALADCGIIEPGYADASIRRKQTFVRKEGVKKQPGAPDSAGPDAPPAPKHSGIDMTKEYF